VSYVTLQWESYDAKSKHRDLLQLQGCFYEAQKILQKTGAYLRQFLVDDKGCVLIGCWGMPNLSYLDNAHRALSAAAQIHRQLNRMEMACSFGITTGDVYCGTVGSALRMEYAAIGSVVNMSARLMCKAHGGILVDDATYRRLPADVVPMLTSLEPMKVKGRDDPLQVYSYVASESLEVQEKVVEDHEISAVHRECMMRFLAAFSENAAKTVEPKTKTRRRGIANVKDWVTAQSPAANALPADLNTVQVLLVKGKEGSGRTTVVKWLRRRVEDLAVPVFGVKLTRKDIQTDYIVWKKLFALLMPKGLFQSTEVQRNYVRALLQEVYPNQSHVAMYTAFPVMKDTLGITCSYAAPGPGHQLQQTKSRWMSQQSSSSLGSNVNGISQAKTIDTLCKIFSYLMNAQASVLVIENMRHADECSMKVLAELLTCKSRSAVVLSSLDSVEEIHTDSMYQVGSFRKNRLKSCSWQRQYKTLFVNHKSCTVVTLENYTPEDIDRMLQKALNVVSVPAEVSKLVQDFSGGSCFWVREILQFIKDHGAEQFLEAVGEVDTTASTVGTLSAHNSVDDLSASSGMRTPKLMIPMRSAFSSSSNLAQATGFQRKASRLQSFRNPGARPARSSEAAHQVQLDKLVLCRFGSLSPDVQRVLRTASIIGFTFTSAVLAEVLPAQLRERLGECFQTLLNQRWIYQDFDIDSLYQFAHDHTHHLIYELTPSSERSATHRQVAEHIEATSAGDESQYAPLCFHYQHCDPAKALQYADLATSALFRAAKVIYDFGDCLDLLVGTIPCCRSTSDVDELLVIINNAKTAVEAFSINVDTQPKGCVDSLIAALCGPRAAAVHPQHCDDDELDTEHLDSDRAHAFSEKDLTATPLHARRGTSSKGSDKVSEKVSSKRDEERLLERRSKARFKKQLVLMYDAVCEKYVEFADAEDG
jgi:hypothetical protein